MQPITQRYIFSDRIREHTAPNVNDRIDLLTQAQIDRVASQGRDAVERRLAELDQEWDIDRALMLTFSILGGATFSAGTFTRKKGWLYLFMVQMGFLGVHAAKGWCPPVSLFRRMNFRTRTEIEAEKHALLFLLREAEGRRSHPGEARRRA